MQRRVMQRSVRNDTVSWRTRLHNNSTKYLLHASMTFFFFVQSWVDIFTDCTPHRGSSCARVSRHPCVQSVTLRLWTLQSIQLLPLLFILLQEDSSNTAYSAKKEMRSTDESNLHTYSVMESKYRNRHISWRTELHQALYKRKHAPNETTCAWDTRAHCRARFDIIWPKSLLVQIQQVTMVTVKTTSSDPCSRCRVYNNWLQIRIDDHRTVWLQVQKWTTKSRRKEFFFWVYVCVVKPSTTPMTTWPSRVLRLRGETEHDTNDNVTTKTQNTLLVSQVLVVMFQKFHRMGQGCCACHLIHAWSVRFSFDFESFIPFFFFFFIFPFIFYILHFFVHFLHYLEGRSKPVHSA